MVESVAEAKDFARTYAKGNAIVALSSDLPSPWVTYEGSADEGDRWKLTRAYVHVVIETLKDDRDPTIRLPAGFTFDLASIPRLLWPIIAPFELSIVAPLIHDALYRCGGFLEKNQVSPYRWWTRAEADKEFLACMKAEGVSWWRRYSAYAAVRAFGWSSW